MIRFSIFILYLSLIFVDYSFANIWPISGSYYTPDIIIRMTEHVNCHRTPHRFAAGFTELVKL
jgi:hypothetical protein